MGIKERKAREKRARQELILQAAKTMFLSKGFEQTTIEDIANEAELSTGTLYLYFKSKEDLYVAVFLHGLNHLYEQLEVLRGDFGTVDAEILLKNLMDIYYRFYHESPEFVYTMSQVYRGKAQEKVEPAIWNAMIGKARDCLKIFSDMIAQGIRDGNFREVDCWKAASTFWAALSGVMMAIEGEAKQEVLNIPEEELLDYTFHMVLRTLQK